jgi:hypothetical protein
VLILAPGQSVQSAMPGQFGESRDRSEAVLSPQSTDSSPGYDGAIKVNLGQALSKRPGGQIAGQEEEDWSKR